MKVRFKAFSKSANVRFTRARLAGVGRRSLKSTRSGAIGRFQSGLILPGAYGPAEREVPLMGWLMDGQRSLSLQFHFLHRERTLDDPCPRHSSYPSARWPTFT